MNRFKEFNIKPQERGFEGEKLKISKVLNREITVRRYKIEDSKVFKEGGKCLQLEIELDGKKHVVFTGSTGLIDAIKQVPVDCFPFLATIIEENERFMFT